MIIHILLRKTGMLFCFLCIQLSYAQCTDCSTVVTDNTVSTYTVSSGQKLCIVGNFTYTGNLILNGGTICNNGTVTKILFKSGTFNNNLTGEIVASSDDDMVFALNGKTVLNDYTGGQIVLNDSLKVTGQTNDSLIVNIYKGASLSCEDLDFRIGIGAFNIGLAATTTTNSSYITALNINGNATFNYPQSISVNELSSLNITGKLIFKNTGVKVLTNRGSVSIGDSLNIKGDGQNTSTVTINNYGDFSTYGSIHPSIVNCPVKLFNYPGLTTAVMYVEEFINIGGTNMQLSNSDVMLVDDQIHIGYGTFNNNFYLEAKDLNIDYGTVTNDSLIFLSGNLGINETDGSLNNNGVVFADNFVNSGTMTMGINSKLSVTNFKNQDAGLVTGPSTGDEDEYAKIFITSFSQNSGTLTGSLFFIDNTNTKPVIKIDEIGPHSQTGPDILFLYDCKQEAALFSAAASPSKRLRTKFCPGEDINLSLIPYFTVVSGPSWSFGVSAGSTPFSTGTSVPILGIISGGTVTATGIFSTNSHTCNFSVTYSISVGNGSITTASPTYFGNGNNVTLNSTVTVGSVPYQYTWTPNYFFVAPSSVSDEDPIIAPQVAMVYTVSMKDGYGCTASNTLEIIGEPFATLDKELNGEYYTLFDNQLFFKHEGQYDASNIRYFVYNKTHSVVASSASNNLVNITSLVPGDNRLTLNAGTLSTGYYILELINEKDEKTYLRFKK